jgi:hypothetical protein
MRHELDIDLPKLGKRTYLHGTSIFNSMLECGDRLLGAHWLTRTTITAYKLIRESYGNGRFVVADAAVDGLDAAATLVAEGPAGPFFGYFIPGEREAAREPYDEDSFYTAVRVGAQFDGEFVLGPRPRADFIRGVVGANKRVHQQAGAFAVEPTTIRFLYLMGLDGALLPATCPEYRLSISNLKTQKRPDAIWTINRVSIEGDGRRGEFRLCYSAAP